MEVLFRNLLERVPELATMVLMVWLFMKYLSKRDDQIKETLERRDQILKEMGNESNLAQRDSREALDRNTHVLGKVHEAMHNNSTALTEVTKALARVNGRS